MRAHASDDDATNLSAAAMIVTSARDLSSSTSPRVGEVLAGKYRVERVLGRGGMGLVVAATHLHLGEQVAIKVFLPGARLRADSFERFLREGRAAARMRSEHVARVQDAGVLESGEPYLVLEYLEGVDLRTLLRERGKLSIDTALVYVLQVCEALAEAHSLGIIHRDLKLSNLFLTRRADGSAIVKVIDFGISKVTVPLAPGDATSSLTDSGTAMGTPGYMAPEQMRSTRTTDARADIWSLGTILYRLLTGSLPFGGESMVEVYDRILKGTPSLRAARGDVPPELDAVVRRCLQFDRAERYEDVGQLAEALAEIAPHVGRLSSERAIRTVRKRPLAGDLLDGDGPRDGGLAGEDPDRASGVTVEPASLPTRRALEGSTEMECSTSAAQEQPSWVRSGVSERVPSLRVGSAAAPVSTPAQPIMSVGSASARPTDARGTLRPSLLVAAVAFAIVGAATGYGVRDRLLNEAKVESTALADSRHEDATSSATMASPVPAATVAALAPLPIASSAEPPPRPTGAVLAAPASTSTSALLAAPASTSSAAPRPSAHSRPATMPLPPTAVTAVTAGPPPSTKTLELSETPD